MSITTKWCPDEATINTALDEIEQHKVVGYDSEFDGVNILHESTVGRAKVHVFSLATPSNVITALNYRVPNSWVFPAVAFHYPRMKTLLENPDVKKPIHNQPVDSHAAYNAGVTLRGCINTLAMARFLYPWRSQLLSGNFDLDSLCNWRVGFGKTEDFDSFLGYDAQEEFTSEETRQLCACGIVGCRKRKAPHDEKSPILATVTRTRKVRRIIPLVDLKPGHPLWERYLAYAASDAELAFILYQMMLIDGEKERPYPWTFGTF